jgi:glycosyltransferase involved in cell wall biosynthesis
MKIALDLQAAVTQQAGIGRYTRELATHLLPLLDADTQLRLDYFDFRREAVIPQALKGYPGLHPVRWVPGSLMQKAWNHLAFPPYDCIHGAADIFHFPNFLAPPKKAGKTVATIHDLSFMRYPQFTEPRNLRNLTRGMQHTLQQADAILTISRFSAQEIATFLAVPPEKIYPIHLGINQAFKPPPPAGVDNFKTRNGIYRPYILTVGTIEPRKNLGFLIELLEQLQEYDGDLILAGGLGWHYEPILARIEQSPCKKQIRRIGYIPDQELPLLYAGADAFLLPSFYEGFGFPPLEAMACGTPVIASTGGSLREVLQDGAICHDHYDPKAWLQSLEIVLSDKLLREDLIRRGHRVAKQYTWEHTARKTLDVYRTVLS